ncbi:Deoxyguanosinetriphosphate triphosphohydrolase [Enhygromyxa salina]|uniref:Deoxyguanosinetriphosphate triphosphohydrolase n=1 Tax=Enhygromyxa salina TaxID=215803 RepID=A0A0C1Z9A8_9BACT|nr:HD domain-containing protein [Enhygromyxa salina]KIG14169.1 Deoxyguanosinetriphosphate triphosphohydrolase [Enhygromyxa salina]
MILRDPVHGLISFSLRDGPRSAGHRLLVRLIDTREVQRLRRIRALGLASLAFPGGEHSRFAHAVGSAHVMQRYLERVRSLADELPSHDRIDPWWEAIALAAALLHDLGHGPLSHTFEQVVPKAHARTHEAWTTQIIMDADTEVHAALREFDEQAPAAVERLIHGVCPIRHLARAVSGTFDVDRCDYLMRDSHMTGVRYGLLDLEWLLASLRLYLPAGGTAATLAVDGAKGLTAVEGFFLARLYMYRQLYLHKAVRAAEVTIRAMFRRLGELLQTYAEAAPGTPAALVQLFRGRELSTREYLDLDDSALETALSHYAGGHERQDPTLAALATAVRERKLLKSVKLRDEISDEQVRARVDPVVAAAGFDPRYFAATDRVKIHAYVEDEALVVLSGPRVQSLLEASPLMYALSSQEFVSYRVMFPAAAREAVSAAVEDLR